MCGINGIIEKPAKIKNEISIVLGTMNSLIVHRGPDEDGSFIEETDEFSLGMAMRRLSIIDLTSGKQPIYSEDKRIVIVFNGEIYNYKLLKSKLEAENVKFNTTSDTEVILKLYENYGPDSFKWLDGMFAFSIYDKKLKKVFIARDFFGEKPLYYSHSRLQFIWASELKSIINILDYKPEISKKALNIYFRLTYIPAPFTIYENIFKLEPNHYIEFDVINQQKKIQQINQETIPNKESISFENAKKNIRELIYKSVESRSVADVNLGTFLSGGVDSSIISHCLSDISDRKIETFSIGFEKKAFDETDKSQTVAKLINSNHHEFIVTENDFRNKVDDILLNFDEPFADSSALPTYLVSNCTKDYVKVALTGDGGDEVFGGYNKYYIGKLNTKYTSIVPSSLHSEILKLSSKLLKTNNDNRGYRFKINRLLKAVDYDGNHYWDIISLAFTDSEKLELIKHNKLITDTFSELKKRYDLYKPQNLIEFRALDKKVSLEGDMLVKVDRTSMLNSLECRAPFLNKEIWDYANSLPQNYLIKGWNKKFILKEAFSDKFPKGFLDKPKQGFGVPVGDWLRSSLKQELESYIEPDFLETQGYFNSSYIIELVKNHISGKRDNSMRVWCFFVFQKWYLNTYCII